MIRAVLFDYDGVITEGVKDGTLALRLANNLKVTTTQASAWLKLIWPPFLIGEISEAEVWQRLEALHGEPIPAQQRDIWFRWNELTPLTQMIEAVKSLKTKGVRVGLLSNVTVPTADLIRQNGGYKEFDFLILACDVGVAKPDPQIFQLALNQLPEIDPQTILYLDDRESAIVTARQFGMQTILVKNPLEAVNQIKAQI